MFTTATRRESDLWLLESLVPGTGVNNLSLTFEAAGRLDPDLLQRALNAVIDRHRTLRTVFRDRDEGLVREEREPGRVRVPVTVRADGAAVRTADLTGYIAEPFALDGGPMLRARLFRGPNGDTVCLAVHHLVFDALSGQVVLADLITAYEALAEGRGLPDGFRAGPYLPETEPTAESLAFWKRHLDGYRPDRLGLWCDRPDTGAAPLRGEILHHTLSEAADHGADRLRRELRAPKAVALLAAYQLLLTLHGAGPDLAVGMPVSVRGTAAQQVVGYHVNMLPLRVDTGPERTVREAAADTRAAFFAGLAHPDVPAETHLADLRGEHTTWRNTLFRHVFNYLPSDLRKGFTIAGTPAVQTLVENGTSKYDLEFFLSESADTALLSVVFNPEVLDGSDVGLLALRYDELLAGLPDRLDSAIGDLTPWSARDRALIPEPPAVVPDPGAALLDAVAGHAAANPGAPAVDSGSGTAVGYAQLLDDARACASAGPVPDLGRRGTGTKGPACAAAALAELVRTPSGSGDPVRRAAATAAELAAAVDAAPGDRVLWAAPAGSDEALLELFLALSAGATAVVPPEGAEPGSVPADLVHASPGELRRAVRAVGGVPASWRRVIAGGEPMPRSLAAELLAHGATVVHAYAPEEAFGDGPGYVAVRRVRDAQESPALLGRPPGHLRLSVAGPDGAPLPVGLRGRLAVEHDGRVRVTTDRARWRPDGMLELVGGPADPGGGPDPREAELALVDHPAVAAAAVVAPDTGDGEGGAPTAFVVPADGAPRPAELTGVLTAHCAARLAPPAVPARVVLLDDLPLDRGRPDRAALARWIPDTEPGAGAESSADDPLAAELTELWTELLSAGGAPGEADGATNFFNAGGNSLLGAQLVQRVRKTTGAMVKLADLFTEPTPRGLARLLRGPEYGVVGGPLP